LDYPVLACNEGHEKRETFPDFNVFWTDELTHSKELWARSKGLLLKNRYCLHCGKSLEKDNGIQGLCAIKLQKNKTERFTAEIEGPISICSTCNTKQIDPAHLSEVMEAFSKALRNSSIKRY
jgi:hypothetical protein